MNNSQDEAVRASFSNVQNAPLLADDINTDFEPPWFMRRDYRDDPRFVRLNENLKEICEQFMRDGYIVFENVLSDELCLQTIEEFQKFAQRNADYFDPFRSENGHLERIINLHLALPALAELFVQAKPVLDFQDALFGKPTSIHTSL